MFLVLDESMSGRRPKTLATGGLPNITFQPCKPVNLGSMLRNAVECFSGILAFQDSVEDLTSQRLKKYLQDDSASSMPGGGDLKVHVAETLRQCGGEGLVRGGWVGGDPWFGSIDCAVELKRRLVVYSSECSLLYFDTTS